MYSNFHIIPLYWSVTTKTALLNIYNSWCIAVTLDWSRSRDRIMLWRHDRTKRSTEWQDSSFALYISMGKMRTLLTLLVYCRHSSSHCSPLRTKPTYFLGDSNYGNHFLAQPVIISQEYYFMPSMSFFFFLSTWFIIGTSFHHEANFFLETEENLITAVHMIFNVERTNCHAFRFLFSREFYFRNCNEWQSDTSRSNKTFLKLLSPNVHHLRNCATSGERETNVPFYSFLHSFDKGPSTGAETFPNLGFWYLLFYDFDAMLWL